MDYNLNIEKQRHQLTEVINYLKNSGLKQKDIACEIGVDSIYIAHLRSGIIKNIPSEVIEGLHDAFNINPRYITHGASNMFDTKTMKYENFDCFIDSWDLIEHENKPYLHFFMDENFYNFLINVFNLKEASSKTADYQKIAEAFEKALKENSTTISIPKEYVLIPADDMLEIAKNNINERKNLNEVMNILEYFSPE